MAETRVKFVRQRPTFDSVLGVGGIRDSPNTPNTSSQSNDWLIDHHLGSSKCGGPGSCEQLIQANRITQI